MVRLREGAGEGREGSADEEKRQLQTDDYSVTGLAQKNLEGRLGRNERVATATLPTKSTDILALIAGFTHVQFVATDAGRLLLLGFEVEGALSVIDLGEGAP